MVKIHTDLKVGEYYGAKGVDHWKSEDWGNQISDVEVCSSTKIRSGSLKLVLIPGFGQLEGGEGFSHVFVWFWELGRL